MTVSKHKIDVNIVDDHTMLTEGLTDAINRSGTAHVSRTFNTLEACQQAIKERRPDVLLLDISIPGGNAIDFCRQMFSDYPKMKVLAITIHDEYSVIQRMLDSGAHGYVLKSASVQELLDAISAVYQGERYISREVEDIIRQGESKAVVLTTVEQNILRLICEGYTNPEIANKLNLSTETVNWYRKRLLAKFGAKNTVTLVKQALTEKIV